MTTGDPCADVNRRAAAIFADIDDYQEQVFLAEINALAAELRPTILTACSTAPAPKIPGATPSRPSRFTGKPWAMAA
jgi:hypothetical protein